MEKKKEPSIIEVRRQTTKFGESGYNIYLLGYLIDRQWNTKSAAVRLHVRGLQAKAKAELIKLGWTPPRCIKKD